MALVEYVHTMLSMAGAFFFFCCFSSPKLRRMGTLLQASREDLAFVFLRKHLGKIRVFEVVRIEWKMESVKVTAKWMVFICCCSHSCLLAPY